MKRKDTEDKETQENEAEKRRKEEQQKRYEEQNKPTCDNCGSKDHLAGSCPLPERPGIR